MPQTLAQFVRSHLDTIMAEWESFAETLNPRGLSSKALRNDAERMLVNIARDMETIQSPDQQNDKAHGKGPTTSQSAAHDHGSQRLEQGFTLSEMISEYRALRGSVIRLWRVKNGEAADPAMLELIRFNEAVDQSIAESLSRFTRDLDARRDLLLGALGHDIRTPLNAIVLSAQALRMGEAPGSRAAAQSSRILVSARKIESLANDLLDFTRTRIGSRLPLRLAECDIAAIIESVLAELRIVHPMHRFEASLEQHLRITGDPDRLAQAIANVVVNAVHYGAPGAPISVGCAATEYGVVVTVANSGASIPASEIDRIFDPLVRVAALNDHGNTGLGLYIVKEIVSAHGGTVSVQSVPGERTCFTMTFPRGGPATPGVGSGTGP